MEYKKEYLEAFLKNQGQLFDEPVAETLEEADEFLQDCMAYVARDAREVKRYFEENGADTEVFRMPDEKYLIVEG